MADDVWFLSDRAIERPEDDRFGHDDVAAQIAHIVESVKPPATLGLIGGFGTGKSSVGNLLAARLKGHSKLQVISLSGERHTGLVRQRAIVYSFAEALVHDAGVDRGAADTALARLEAGEDVEVQDLSLLPLRRFLRDHWRALRTLALTAVTAAFALYLAAVLGVVIANGFREHNLNPLSWPLTSAYLSIPIWAALGTVLLGSISPWINASLTPGKRTSHRPRAEAPDELERVFEKLAALCKKRLVVVVDDIDRLPPAEVLEALATIKNLQAVPRKRPPVFVIACDDDIIRKAIQLADPGLSPVDGSARRAADEYLNKLFLVRQPLPPSLPEDMIGFAENLLRTALPRHAGPAALDDDLPRVLEVLIHEGVREPRHVVRLLNAFFADLRLARVREGREGRLAPGAVTGSPLTLARLTVLRVDFYDAYAAVMDEYELLGALDSAALGGQLDAAQVEIVEAAELRDTSTVERGDEQHSGTDEDGGITVRRDLSDFLRRTARYVERDVPLAPFFYLTQTDAGRVLGSRRAEEIRVALESNDVETVRARLEGDAAIADAAIEQIAATLRRSRPGLALSNATQTAAYSLSAAATSGRASLASRIADTISRQPQESFAPESLAPVITYAADVYRPALISRLVRFDDEEDNEQRASTIARLAIELPHEQQLVAALDTFFTRASDTLSFAILKHWIAQASDMSVPDRNRILGVHFYAAIINSVVGTEEGAVEVANANPFMACLGDADDEVRADDTLAQSVQNALAANGMEPRLFGMRAAACLLHAKDDIVEWSLAIAEGMGKASDGVYTGTIVEGLRLLARFATEHRETLAGVEVEQRDVIVAAVTAALGYERPEIARAAAGAAAAVADVWDEGLSTMVGALSAALDTHRDADEDTARSLQSALVAISRSQPQADGQTAAGAILSPVATATDDNATSFRMAIGGLADLLGSEIGRSYVVAHVPAWRQVFQNAVQSAEQVRPQAEALALAARGGAVAAEEQTAVLTALQSAVAQGQPRIDIAAETASAIAFDDTSRGQAGELLASVWADLTAATRRRVVTSLTQWDIEGPSPSSALFAAVAEFVIADDEPHESQLAHLWPWIPLASRGAALASGIMSVQFVASRLAEADVDERRAALAAAAEVGRVDLIADRLDDVPGTATSDAARRFIEDSLEDETLAWDDDSVRTLTRLLSAEDAHKLAQRSVALMQNGALAAGHGASLVAWLRPHADGRLSSLNEPLAEQILQLLPQADRDLAGRLGHASAPLPKRAFSDTLRAMRGRKESQESNAAADAFESGRSRKP